MPEGSERVALFPGSFDPFTKGHYDIAQRSLQVFDRLVIAIGENKKKERFFSAHLMCGLVKKVFSSQEKVAVHAYTALTARMAAAHRANFLVRGLRNTTDFELENSLAQLNKHLKHDLETVFFITSPQYAHISSSLVREGYEYGADISSFLPYTLPSKSSA